MTYCGYVDFSMVFIFVVLTLLLLLLLFLGLIFIINNRFLLVTFKVFCVPFFGDWELLFTVWGFLFLLIVVFIRARVIIFSLSYIRRLSVTNFVSLYLLFILSIV
jgi:hypothetical protein